VRDRVRCNLSSLLSRKIETIYDVLWVIFVAMKQRRRVAVASERVSARVRERESVAKQTVPSTDVLYTRKERPAHAATQP
jgi:hypothetical protein